MPYGPSRGGVNHTFNPSSADLASAGRAKGSEAKQTGVEKVFDAPGVVLVLGIVVFPHSPENLRTKEVRLEDCTQAGAGVRYRSATDLKRNFG